MTSEATATRPAADRRDGWRRELADLLDVTPAALTDEARLGEDLGLDSLARMSLLAWLDGKGVSLTDPQGKFKQFNYSASDGLGRGSC